MSCVGVGENFAAAVRLKINQISPFLKFSAISFKSNLFITGKRQVFPPKKEGDMGSELYMGMSTKPAQKIAGYRLSRDDPTGFRDKNTFITCDRAFPTEEYPEGADSDILPPVVQSTSSQPPDTSTKQRQESRAMIIRMHTELVKMAQKMGISDLCACDRDSRVENVLEGITRVDLTCKFCQKKLSSVTHLKTHIKAMHLHKTAHKCTLYNRYFLQTTTLRRHLPMHDTSAQKFKCTVKVKDKDGEEVECGKEFISESKLVDHQVVHQSATPFMCFYCKKKSFKKQKGQLAHEKVCDDNPNKEDLVNCRLCPKQFKERKSMLRHFRTAHFGQDPDV